MPVTPRIPFRSRKGAAPLKHAVVSHRRTRIGVAFRSRKGAAPLKQRDGCAYNGKHGAFRSRKGAAPLKLAARVVFRAFPQNPFRSRKGAAPLKPNQSTISAAAMFLHSALERERPH